jgi:hypothetical protein
MQFKEDILGDLLGDSGLIHDVKEQGKNHALMNFDQFRESRAATGAGLGEKFVACIGPRLHLRTIPVTHRSRAEVAKKLRGGWLREEPVEFVVAAMAAKCTHADHTEYAVDHRK